jgi:hypothetical protein
MLYVCESRTVDLSLGVSASGDSAEGSSLRAEATANLSPSERRRGCACNHSARASTAHTTTTGTTSRIHPSLSRSRSPHVRDRPASPSVPNSHCERGTDQDTQEKHRVPRRQQPHEGSCDRRPASNHEQRPMHLKPPNAPRLLELTLSRPARLTVSQSWHAH